MVDGSITLPAKLYVRQIYDFSKAYAISFMWWGANQGDTVDLKLQTPTGNFLTSFSDGPASWREVLIPWRLFNETGQQGSPPDKSRITAILWTVHSPGIRRVDLFRLFESPILKALFEVRRSATSDVGGEFVVKAAASGELKAGFSVS
jgi:hypothetical protein